MELWPALDRLAARQHSLLTRRQLRFAGVTDIRIKRLVRQGQLVPVRRGVFRTAGSPMTRHQAWLAAVLAVGGDAVLSHACAAVLWELRGFRADDGIDVLTTRRGRMQLQGVRTHSTIHLPDCDRTTRSCIPVTSAARTLVDGCGLVGLPALGRAIDDALRRKVTTLRELARCSRSVPLSGRRPIRPMRAVLAERIPGYDAGGSDAELDVMRVLRRAGVQPLPRQQYRVKVEGRTYFLDYAWPETMHALEYQGEAWHGTVSALHDDSERTRRLQRAGWNPWPLTSRTSTDELLAIAAIATRAAA